MSLVFLVTVLIALQGPTPTPRETNETPHQKTSAADHTAPDYVRGTEQSPLVVKTLPALDAKERSQQEAKDREEKSSSDLWTVRLTGTLAFIGFLQFLVYWYQAKKLRETVESANAQGEAMERHIIEAARSAKAMEDVVSVITKGNRAALRAYLTVSIGGAVFQQREADRQGQGDVRFEGKPQLINTGNTPARNVLIRTAADILPSPIPLDFTFPLRDLGVESRVTQVVGSRHQYELSAMVNRFVPDAEIGAIKRGDGQVLCVWGTITYEDIFGDPHTTKFGQALTWWPNGAVFGYYIEGQNDAD